MCDKNRLLRLVLLCINAYMLQHNCCSSKPLEGASG
jgi:hypothetical protein